MQRIRSIARAAVLALGLATGVAGVQAQSFSTDGGTAFSLGSGSGFDPQWLGNGADYSMFDLGSMLRGASLLLTGPAELTFTLAGFEADYNNSFLAGGEQLSTRDGGLSGLGSSFSFIQTATGALDFGFITNGWAHTLVNNGSRMTGLLLSADQREALIVFNDAYPGDFDFDDMVVRVSITPVPEPETVLMWLAGLAGLGGWVRHRRSARAKA